MRARGAQVTDIAILVVAADDGVMPQTVEAINHAQAADVPIVVAVNKIDKDGANPEKVRGQLTEFGLVPEEYGGSTHVRRHLRQAGHGHRRAARGRAAHRRRRRSTCVPTRTWMPAASPSKPDLDKGRGAVATVLVQRGTLHMGDSLVAGTSYGRVRAMLDDARTSTSMEAAAVDTCAGARPHLACPRAGDLVPGCSG